MPIISKIHLYEQPELHVLSVRSTINFNKDSMEQYKNLNQPSFAPPGWIFPVVWTILFILMGLASYLVYREGFENLEVKSALFVYAAQLVVNFFWTILFF